MGPRPGLEGALTYGVEQLLSKSSKMVSPLLESEGSGFAVLRSISLLVFVLWGVGEGKVTVLTVSET